MPTSHASNTPGLATTAPTAERLPEPFRTGVTLAAERLYLDQVIAASDGRLDVTTADPLAQRVRSDACRVRSIGR